MNLIEIALPLKLTKPITTFKIPTVNAECVIDESATAVKYLPPEQVDIVDSDTSQIFHTCQVPVMKNGRLRGYMPLPMRYRQTWLELSYCIILHTQMWRLWTKEEAKARKRSIKNKAAALRQNSGACVAQHMLARLMAAEELVSLSHDPSIPGVERVRILDEWKIRWYRDWFNTTHDKAAEEGAKFLEADPIEDGNRGFFGGSNLLDDIHIPSKHGCESRAGLERECEVQ